MTLLSIIIPSFNCACTLPKTLDSLLRADASDIEIIVVNDGSTDDTSSVAKGYEGIFSNLSVIDQENRGLSGARNTGFTAATGEWVMFADSDDWLFEDGLRAALEATSSASDVVLFPFVLSSDPQYLRGSKVSIDIASAWDDIAIEARVLRDIMLSNKTRCSKEDIMRINACNINSSCSRIMRRSTLAEIYKCMDRYGNNELFYESVTSMGEDRFFNIRLWGELGEATVVFSPRALYFYNVGADKITAQHVTPQILDHLKPRFDVIQTRMKESCLTPREADNLFTKDLWEYFCSTSLLEDERAEVEERWFQLLQDEDWGERFHHLPGQPLAAKANSIVAGWMIRHGLLSAALKMDNRLLRILAN